MGNIVTLPRRGQPGDLDTLGKVATLSVLAVELACLAQHGEADEIEITLNGERLTLDRQTCCYTPTTCSRSGRRSLTPWGSAARN